MTLPRVGAAQLTELLPMEAAIDALEAAFRIDRLPEAPLRQHVPAGTGDLLLMPAVGPQGAGVKLVTVTPPNPERGLPLIQGVYVLFAPVTLEPVAVLDGAALTAIRTAAVSGLATRYLARKDARRLVIFGAGTQGRSHLEAMLAVRPVEEVTVVSRSAGPAERLVATAEELGLRAAVGTPEAVAHADLVCTCTTSDSPVFEGSRLPHGAHVNAVGAYRPDARELDEDTIRRARVVVETREAALEEAGDLVIPIKDGAIGAEHIVADLREVVRGAEVRRSEDDVTVFKSVGVAFEDLAVARAAVDRLSA
jgi:ornithine cyclodeaminase/alanine dehydrogenase-like protein (mu-crystallin family)